MKFQSLSELLRYFEENEESFDEDDIDSALRSLDKEKEENLHFKSERLAFGFYPDPNSNHNWGTYFGPKMVLPNEDGQYVESPSIKHVDKDVIKYWKKRAKNTSHPLLKTRYNDLIWDFSQNTINEKPNYKHAEEVILSTVELIQTGLYEHLNLIKEKLDRALELSLSLNNPDLQEKVKNCYLDLYDKEKNDNPAFINHLFEKLVKENQELLIGNEEQRIINELDTNLDDAVVKTDIFEAEMYSFNLAEYHRGNDSHKKAKKALKKYQQVIEKTLEKNSALIVSSYLKKLYDKYVEYGFNEEANKLNSLLQEYGVKSVKSMGVFEHQFQIPKELIEKFKQEVISGDFDEVVLKIISQFLPSKETTEQQVTDLAKKTALQALVGQTVQDKDGRIIAQIGPVHEDLEGRIVRQLYQNMSFESYFLRLILSDFLSGINKDMNKIIDHLSKSPVFNEDATSFLRNGLLKYFEGDYFGSIHIFIPLIEKCLRNLLKIIGRPIYKPGRHGGLFLRNLGDILSDPFVNQVLGEDVIFYLKVLLIDQRGWNLRNDVLHGIKEYEDFRIEIADRLFHVLLLLSLIRVNDTDE